MGEENVLRLAQVKWEHHHISLLLSTAEHRPPYSSVTAPMPPVSNESPQNGWDKGRKMMMTIFHSLY